MKSESREMTSRTAKVVAKPVRSIPRISPVRAQRVPPRRARPGQTRCEPGSASRRRSALPARVVRMNSAMPISRSSVAIVRDAVDWECSARDQPRKSSLAGDPSEQPQREEAVAHSAGG